MIDAAESIAQFLTGRTRSDLDSDRMLLFAIVRAIEVVGEAASKVTNETRVAEPSIPWTAIVSMRNRLIHGYFDIDVGSGNSVRWIPEILSGSGGSADGAGLSRAR